MPRKLCRLFSSDTSLKKRLTAKYHPKVKITLSTMFSFKVSVSPLKLLNRLLTLLCFTGYLKKSFVIAENYLRNILPHDKE